MKNQTVATTKRIVELEKAMQVEAANNFPNGNSWNEMSDKIYNLKNYGQEGQPEDIKDSEGVVIGQLLKDGTQYFFEGMTLNNSF